MEFNLSKEQSLIQQMAREFAEKSIAPVAKQIDEESKIPEEILAGMAELELFGIPFSEEYGGADGGYDGYVLVMEQIAKVSGGIAMTMAAHTLGLGAISAFGTEEQKKKYMVPGCKGKHIVSFAFTEPGTGSDPKQLSSTAKRDGDYYILNGTKRFISNANFPGAMVVFAKETETGEVTAFILDKLSPGYSISEPWEKIGMHGGQLLDVYMKDVKVPVENLLGKIGQGFPVLLLGIALGKIGTSTAALGGTLAAFEEAVKYAREKTHRGQPIAKFQAIQLKIADLAIKYETARWLCYRLGCLANNIKDPAAFAAEAALVKAYCGDNVVDAARIAVDVHGSYGLMRDYTIERVYRDAIIGPEIEGVADMQKMIVAGSILKK
ncbi:MAG: acyl-CoA dehydrogenase family protein [Syntrophomonadaceae bacterium]|nr:acyl-CoA dehydrogenase family protein [Syntrophomonadaceae bacterium]